MNATTFDTDADSWFNAAYMLQNGLGIDADQEKAANMYKHSVTQFGHFGSTFELGKMYLQVSSEFYFSCNALFLFLHTILFIFCSPFFKGNWGGKVYGG